MTNLKEMTNREIIDLVYESSDIEFLENACWELRDRLNIHNADGNLSKLANLREADGALFNDGFFDCKEIAKKYGDWDSEKGWRADDKTNDEIKALLDDEDKKSYIDFLQLESEIIFNELDED